MLWNLEYPPSLQPDDAGLDGAGGSLRAVASVELLENLADMEFHRAHLDGKSARNLLVAVAGRDQAQHLKLADREVGPPQTFGQAAGHDVGHVALTLGDGADGL